MIVRVALCPQIHLVCMQDWVHDPKLCEIGSRFSSVEKDPSPTEEGSTPPPTTVSRVSCVPSRSLYTCSFRLRCTCLFNRCSLQSICFRFILVNWSYKFLMQDSLTIYARDIRIYVFCVDKYRYKTSISNVGTPLHYTKMIVSINIVWLLVWREVTELTFLLASDS